MKKNLEAYVINLKKRPDRLENALSVLNDVDGLDFNVNVVEAFERSNLPFFNNDKLSNAQKGCFRSHIECWKSIIASEKTDDDTMFFVFEDDICEDKQRTKDEWENVFNLLEHENADLINLCIHIKGSEEVVNDFNDYPLSSNLRNTIRKSQNKHIFYKNKSTMFGLCSYILTKKCAKKILEYIYMHEVPINCPVDVFIFEIRYMLNIYLSNKNFFFQNSEFGSDI